MISGKPIQMSDDNEKIVEEVLDLRKCLAAPTKEKLCSWCGKRGVSSPNGLVGSSTWIYCSQRCYEKFRRAVFKKRSACLWCSNVAGRGKISSDFTNQPNLDETKFCSECCLTQYKLKLFCEETTSHLHQIKEKTPGEFNGFNGKDLITPALWLRKDSSPICKEADACFPQTLVTHSGEEKKSQRSTHSVSSHQMTNVKSEKTVVHALRHHDSRPGKESDPKRYRRRISSWNLEFESASTPLTTTFTPLRESARPSSHNRRRSSEGHETRSTCTMASLRTAPRTTLPFSDLSPLALGDEATRTVPQQSVISLVPVPFPLLFPVILSHSLTGRTLDPIEEVE